VSGSPAELSRFTIHASPLIIDYAQLGGAMSFSERISPFLGRSAIAFFFLTEAWMKLASFETTAALLRSENVPAAAALLVVAVTIMVLGGLSLILGYHVRHGALLLFAFTVIVTVLLHAYWTVTDSSGRIAEFEIFIRNMAVAGGLLVIVGMGSGPFAFDNIEWR
jgi:putative oxidoreductase